MTRPIKDRTGRMSKLHAQQELYTGRRVQLNKRLQHAKNMIADNEKKLEKVKKEIRLAIHGKK